MSILKKLFSLLPIAALFITAACSSNKEKAAEVTSTDARFEQDMVRTEQDSLDIINLSKQYLDLLKADSLDQALDMLYEMNSDGKMEPISASRRQELIEHLQQFPVLSYTIDQMLLYSETDTELRYTYEFFVKPEGMEGMNNTTKGALMPHRVDGKWYLTVALFKSEKSEQIDEAADEQPEE